MARQNTLTETDWFNLLEERRNLLAPHLREMTLKALGDLNIVRYCNKDVRPLRMGGVIERVSKFAPYRHYLDWGGPKIVEGNFPLETRGIFANDDIYYNGHFKWDFIRAPGRIEAVGEIVKFWGLTRNNQWIKAEATIQFFDDRNEHLVEVQKLTIYESTPEEVCQFCGVTPRWLWQQLGDAVEAWVTHRKRLLSKAEQLFEVIKQENVLADIVAPQ